jgi:molybdate transport system ATP-binding protein
MGNLLIQLDHVNVALDGHRVLHDVTWSLRRGENWAVLGPNGAGKSTFLRLLRGEVWPAPVDGGKRTYAFDGQPTQSPIGVPRRMAIVSAEQQQRYARAHGRRYGDDFGRFITVRDIVFTGLLASELVTRRPRPAETAEVRRVMRDVGIEDLAEIPFDKLSQGQLRKALIARAIVGRPDVLILDEVGAGLDARSRRALLDMIQRITSSFPWNWGPHGATGLQILMTTHRRDELIPAITNALEIKGGRIVAIFSSPRPAPNRRVGTGRRFEPIINVTSREARPFLINTTHANVALDEGTKVVLHDVTWRMNEGEHWMIQGDNGVGKTTLLKLILGELRPAHGGTIERFGRDGCRNVWEIKRHIGYASADLQARYSVDLTAEQVIATGFSGSVGWLQRISRQERELVDQAIERFGLQALAKRSILQMSYGQARRVLVARALVASPRIIILDDVFDGLDAHVRAQLAATLEGIASTRGASGGVGLILAAHHDADCLPFITHRMVIEGGRIVSQEQRFPTP